MDDRMIDLTLGEGRLRQRLEAYAEARLSPDPATAARLRARVLAVAHRQADLRRGDAGLTIVPSTIRQGPGIEAHATGRSGRRSAPGRRARLAAAMLAAALVLGGAGAAAVAAAGPGGALYETRLWAERLVLPAEPSVRALAELERLELRLAEARAAARDGDIPALTAALGAYERILDQATGAVVAADDPVAEAALEAGVGRNVEVLHALVDQVPSTAGGAIGRAIDRAIERSDAAVDTIEPGRPGRGNGNGAGGPDPAATPRPTKEPKPTAGPAAEPTPKPTPKGGKPDKPDPTPRRTPKGP